MGNRCRMVLQSDWQSWKLIASSHPLAIHQYYIQQKVATSMPSQPLPHVLCWMCLDLLTLKKMTGTAHITKIIPMLLIQVSELMLFGLHEHFLLWKFAKSVRFISFNIVWQQCKQGVMHMNLSKFSNSLKLNSHLYDELGKKVHCSKYWNFDYWKEFMFEFINCAWFTWQCFNADGEAALTEGNGDCYGWLEEIEMPENSAMDKIPYLGPQVTETSC